MAEKEYIERGKAIDVIVNNPCRWAYHTGKTIAEIKEIPAADVVEVRPAYWKETRHITISKRGREIHSKLYNCSYCDAPNGRKKSSYCHWCGAKMDGERKEQK